jgi:hypothetical protein
MRWNRGRQTAARGQRRFKGWFSGGRTGGRTCGADGAAMEGLPEVAAEARAPPCGSNRLLGRARPQKRGLDQRRAGRRVERGQARQDPERRRLGWPQPCCRLSRLRNAVVVRSERLDRGGGSNQRQMNRQGWTRERSNREESREPYREAATQPPSCMPSRAHKHLPSPVPRTNPRLDRAQNSATQENGLGDERGQAASTAG